MRMKMRMLAGVEEKAGRGELIRTISVGYVRDNKGKAVKDTDKRAQEVTELVLKKFRETQGLTWP